ncbi:MAG TPA: RNA polymerase sigma factor [Vicinamibacterales bacterium]|nr:RNA polymerase sigma factor [Vicinamibacterales bacterium]
MPARTLSFDNLHPIVGCLRIGQQDMLKALDAPVVALVAEDPGDGRLARAQAGDTSAFADMVREHQSMVYSLAYHTLRHPAVAEELAQDVFLDLYRSLARIGSAAHARAWLRRTTSHRCIDRMRRLARRPEVGVEALPDVAAPARPTDVLLAGRLGELIAALPPQPRMIVVLRYQEDLDPSEIAAALNMPVNTVKSHLRRAIAVLRAKLPKEDVDASR